MAAAVPSSPAIRRATAADLPRLGTLGAVLVTAHHEFDPQRFIAAGRRTPAGYESFLATRLDDPEAAIFVAADRAAVFGYAYSELEGADYMSLRGPAGVLHDLIVDPAHRGRGFGRLLLEATLAHLASRGAPRVVLSTAERNVAAQRLFERFGFRRTMIEMTRELDAAAPPAHGGR